MGAMWGPSGRVKRAVPVKKRKQLRDQAEGILAFGGGTVTPEMERDLDDIFSGKCSVNEVCKRITEQYTVS